MIGTIDVEINAAHPEMPLADFAAFVNSPSHVRVRNVPRGVGNWQITAVYLSVNYPDNSLPSVSLTHVGALWTGTIGGSAVAGRSVNGYQITADGVDENGNAVTGYALGVGDVYILNRDATITVDGETYYLHLLNSVPETPHIGDVATIDGSLKLYDGNAWVSFAAGASIDIVPPSTDPEDEGKAADAKATGDALAGKLSKAEAEAGFTEWTLAGLPAGATNATLTFLSGEPPSWQLSYTDGGGMPVTETVTGEADAVELVFSNITATRTRLPTMADITALQTGKADASAIRYDLGEAFVSDISNVFTDNTTNPPTEYVAVALLDRTINCVQLTLGGIEELRLTFPAAVSGKVRDFGLRVEVGDETSALTAPALVPPAGVTLENADGAIPALADGTATAKGVTLLYFSETSPGVFLVKGEQVEEA